MAGLADDMAELADDFADFVGDTDDEMEAIGLLYRVPFSSSPKCSGDDGGLAIIVPSFNSPKLRLRSEASERSLIASSETDCIATQSVLSRCWRAGEECGREKLYTLTLSASW